MLISRFTLFQIGIKLAAKKTKAMILVTEFFSLFVAFRNSGWGMVLHREGQGSDSLINITNSTSMCIAFYCLPQGHAKGQVTKRP